MNGRIPIAARVMVLSTALLALFPAGLRAQFGFKAGLSATSFYYPGNPPTPYSDYDVDLRPYLGYDVELVQTGPQKPLYAAYLGLYRSLDLTRRLGARLEFAFTQKGVDFSRSEYERITYKVRISYLETPVSLTFTILQKERAMVELYAGGYAAIKLSAVKKVGFHDTPVAKTHLSAVKNTEGGVHLGLTYYFKVHGRRLLTDLRVLMGLTNIFALPADRTDLYFENHDTRITGLNLTVGYEF